jgi:hypothetical protein
MERKIVKKETEEKERDYHVVKRKKREAVFKFLRQRHYPSPLQDSDRR